MTEQALVTEILIANSIPERGNEMPNYVPSVPHIQPQHMRNSSHMMRDGKTQTTITTLSLDTHKYYKTVLTQLTVENGEPLFEVEYED